MNRMSIEIEIFKGCSGEVSGKNEERVIRNLREANHRSKVVRIWLSCLLEFCSS
jgi:hypothetical protein